MRVGIRMVMDGRRNTITTVVGTLAGMRALVATWRIALLQNGLGLKTTHNIRRERLGSAKCKIKTDPTRDGA